MRNSVKKILMTFFAIMIAWGLTTYVYAQTSSQEGVILTLMTDKESYQADEAVEVTLRVQNTNETTLHNVQVSADYAKELEPGNMKFHVTNILPGKEDTYIFRVKKAGTSTEKDIGIVKQPPVTGDQTQIIRYVALAVFALIVIVVLIMHNYLKLFAFFLAGALVIGSTGSVQAATQAQRQTIAKSIQIAQVSYTITMTVNYGIEVKSTTIKTTEVSSEAQSTTSQVETTQSEETTQMTETSQSEETTQSEETMQSEESTESAQSETTSKEERTASEVVEDANVAIIPADTVVERYDLNNDGKNDKIQTAVKKRDETYESFKIFINDQEVYDLASTNPEMDINMFDEITTYYLRFASGQSYLMLHSPGEDGFSNIFEIFRYDGMQLVSAYNVNNSCGDNYMISVALNGDVRITDTGLMLDLLIGTPSLGAFTTTLTITENGGMLQSEKEVAIGKLYQSFDDGDHVEESETLTTVRKVDIYSDVQDETAAFTIDSGEAVKPLRLFSENQVIYYAVSYQDQMGWLKENSEDFEEVFAHTVEAYDVP